MSGRRTLTEDEAQHFVLDLLADGEKRLTRDIDHASEKSGVACPDSTARFLNRMRTVGLIEGKLSIPDKSWLWWREPDA